MVDATDFLKTNSAEPGKLSAVQGKTKGKIKRIKIEKWPDRVRGLEISEGAKKIEGEKRTPKKKTMERREKETIVLFHLGHVRWVGEHIKVWTFRWACRPSPLYILFTLKSETKFLSFHTSYPLCNHYKRLPGCQYTNSWTNAWMIVGVMLKIGGVKMINW